MRLLLSFVRLGIASLAFALAVHLTPVGGLGAENGPEPIQKRIDRLVEQLGDADYAVREQAQSELAKLGFAAYEALQEATTHEDLEIASRATYLLRLIRVQWTQEGDPPEVKKRLEDYEFQTADERLDRIRELSRLPGGQGLAALCRLVRFEGSELLSKYAAIEILDRRPAGRAARQRWAKTLRQNLPRGSRAAPRWLLAYLQLHDEPQTALAAWNKLVEAEQALLGRTPAETSSGILASLLYHLAEAQADQGQKQPAEETAARARALNSGKNATALFAHWEVAESLRRRGLFSWAEAEYRHVIDAKVPEFMVLGHTRLSEMRHDQGKHLAAAETLEEMLRVDPRQVQLILGRMQQTVGEIRARMNYFYACHWEEQGDRAKQREYLDKAIEADPGEIDTLIARYKLPDRTPEYHQKTLDLIAKAVAGMRRRIQASPDEPSDYNQLAWLVGNTEGDFDEALKSAHKAVEMSPDSGAYYDTLAHVYFGMGDYQNAVKYQSRAAELEPHSKLIAKQLRVFRAKLEQTTNKPEGADDRPVERRKGKQ